jgi:hypothetical protein
MSFAATDANLDTVTCKLDAATAKPCNASATLSGLAAGTHQFTVSGTDKAGNSASKTRTFSVTSPPPPPPVVDAGGGTNGGTTGGTTGGTPGGTGHLKANPARFVYGYALIGRATRLPVLVAKHVAKGSTITVRCKGKGCPKGKLVLKHRKGAVKLKSLQTRRFQPGVILTIQISTPGMKTKTVKITIRKGARPKVR